MLQENILKQAPHLSHRLLNLSLRILPSKQRILQSLMPNKHPALNHKRHFHFWA